jgi:hypothetical protein
MPFIQQQLTHSQKIRGANATFVDHYAQWASHMLTLTFKEGANSNTPNIAKIDDLLQHIKSTLNWAVWKKRTKHNAKAKILYLPIVEGVNGQKRVHIHILLGNIKDVHTLDRFIKSYISNSPVLGSKYDIRDIYSIDGLSWYLTKETQGINTDAVRWNAALIPSAIVPKAFTLLRA